MSFLASPINSTSLLSLNCGYEICFFLLNIKGQLVNIIYFPCALIDQNDTDLNISFFAFPRFQVMCFSCVPLGCLCIRHQTPSMGSKPGEPTLLRQWESCLTTAVTQSPLFFCPPPQHVHCRWAPILNICSSSLLIMWPSFIWLTGKPIASEN